MVEPGADPQDVAGWNGFGPISHDSIVKVYPTLLSVNGAFQESSTTLKLHRPGLGHAALCSLHRYHTTPAIDLCDPVDCIAGVPIDLIQAQPYIESRIETRAPAYGLNRLLIVGATADR